MDTILLKGKVIRSTRNKDGQVSLAVRTVEEPTSEQVLQLDKVRDQAGYILFGANPAAPSDLPAAPVNDEGRTRSQIMRFTIHRMWENSPKFDEMEFEAYYDKVMDILTNNLEERIPKPAF